MSVRMSFLRLSTAAIAVALALAAPSLAATEPMPALFEGRLIADFGRLQFRTPKPVKFRTQTRGTTVTIEFEQPIAADMVPMLATLKEYITSAAVSDDHTKLIIELKQPYRVRSFIGPDRSGIDLIPQPKPATETLADAKNPAKTEEKLTPDAPITTAQNTDPQKQPQETTKPVTTKPAPEKPTAEKPTAEKPAKLAVQPTPPPLTQTAPPQTAEKPAVKPATPPAEPAPSKPESATKPAAPSTVKPLTATPAPAEPPPAAQPYNAAAPVKQNIEVVASPGGEGEKLTPRFTANGANESLAFDWSQPVYAAAFERMGYGYILFNSPSQLVTQSIERLNSRYIDDIRALPVQGATLLRFRFKHPAGMRMERDQNRWALNFSEEQTTPYDLRIEIQTPNRGTQVTIPVTGFSDPVTYYDEATGTRLSMVALRNPGIGVASARRYQEFQLLPTSQGIAAELTSDGVVLESRRNGIRISSEQGLFVDAPPTTASSIDERELNDFLETGLLLPYERWRAPDGTSLPEALSNRARATSEAPEDKRNAGRLLQARLMMAEGMFPEALGMLKFIQATDPVFAQKYRTASLEGIAHFMRGDIAEARAAFLKPELQGLPEIAMWQTIVGVADGSWKPPVIISDDQKRLIMSYPPEVVRELSFLLTEKAILDKRYDDAMTRLDMARAKGALEGFEGKAQLLMGFVAARTAQPDKAIKMWEPLYDQVDDAMLRARAGLPLAETKFAQNKITRADAIKMLEPLPIIWRGDQQEREILRVLGQLYIDNEQYREGLQTWRELVATFPNSEVATQIAKRMSEVFIELFNQGKIDESSPVDALALYYEFRELTPVGPEGDLMIQKLADRLAQVDLLERAAALLQHQVTYRLQGEERATVATRLAVIYLMNKQPAEAIKALESSQAEDLLPALLQTRRLLMAEALLKTKKLDVAYQLASSVDSPEGRQLATQILWETEDWPRIIAFLNPIVENALSEQPMTNSSAEAVLRLALALRFANQSSELPRLRKTFEKSMRNTPYTESFTFLTEPMADLNHTNLEKVESITRQFSSFMQNIEKKVEEKGVSEVVQ